MKIFALSLLMSLSLFASAAPAPAPHPASTDHLKIEHLGINTTLVRVTGDGRYLLLPIQESNVDTPVMLLVDGNPVNRFHARIAKSKVDYFVPVDLAPYQGKKISLLIETLQDRTSLREVRDDAIWQEIELSDSFDTTNTEPYRPLFHHTPRWGWMNDPNGMFYKDGLWHLYYQWNPYGSKWHNMTWGHSSSPDLIHWTDEGTALIPDALGMIFSGSAVVDRQGSAGFGKDAVIALYTSADATQQQSLAYSLDNGKTLVKYDGNPILTQDTEARDPNMFWHAPTGKWVLTLAHALDHEIQIFSSDDLKTWTLESAFGQGIGAQDGVWECPDLFELPTADGKTKWVLLCNINPGGPFGGSACQYFVGDFDGKTFTPDRDPSGNVITKWMDYGKDNYAAVSWSDAPDARRTVIGWMSNWQYAADVPTTQFRSANTLPREMQLFMGPDSQYYLASVPSPELEALRMKPTVKVKSASVGSKPSSWTLPKTNDGICEILLKLSPKSAASDVNLTLSNAKGEKVVMVFSPSAHTLSFDRTASGLTDFSREFPSVTVSPTFSDRADVELRIFIDRSSIEVFGDGGRFCQTNLVFPSEPYTTLSISSKDGAKVENLTIYPLSIN